MAPKSTRRLSTRERRDEQLQEALEEARSAEYTIPSGASSIGPMSSIKTNEQANAVVDRILMRAGGGSRLSSAS